MVGWLDSCYCLVKVYPHVTKPRGVLCQFSSEMLEGFRCVVQEVVSLGDNRGFHVNPGLNSSSPTAQDFCKELKTFVASVS